jgi:hypothetical protein
VSKGRSADGADNSQDHQRHRDFLKEEVAVLAVRMDGKNTFLRHAFIGQAIHIPVTLDGIDGMRDLCSHDRRSREQNRQQKEQQGFPYQIVHEISPALALECCKDRPAAVPALSTNAAPIISV